MRIGLKLILSFCLIVALVLSSLAVVTTNLINQRMLKFAEEDVDAHLGTAWIQFFIRGDQMRYGMLQVVATPEIQNAVAARDEGYLEELIFRYRKERPYVDIFAVTDERGLVIAKLSDQPIGDASLREIVRGALTLGEPSVKVELLSTEIIAACGGEMFIPKLGSLDLKEGMALVTVVPVFKDGKLVGTIVTADLLLEDFFVTDELEKKFPEAVFLIAQGDTVISTNLKSEGKRAIGIKLPQNLMEEVKAGKTHRAMETLGAKNYISASEAIRDANGNFIGVLLAGQPEERFLALQRENLSAIIVIFFFALLASAATAAVATREITKPVAQLAEATKKIKEKNFDVHISDSRLESRDEIGDLAKSFNIMALELREFYESLEQKVRERTEELEAANEELKVTNEELQTREEELMEVKSKLEEYSKGLEEIVKERTQRIEAMGELSRAVASTLEPEKILEIAVENIKKIIPCEHMSIAIKDEEFGSFYVPAVKTERKTEIVKGMRIPFEDTILTSVCRDKKTALRRDFSKEKLYPIDKELIDEGVKSDLLIPLVVKGKAIGTLNLASYKAGGFSEEQIPVAEEFASQITVGIENARLYGDAKLSRDALLNVVEDLEESKNKLQAAYEELKTIDALKRDIVANVSHELRTPITICKSAIELAMEEKDEKKREELLAMGRNALLKQNRIVGDLIDVARIERGAFKLSIESVDLKQVIEATVQKMLPLALKNEIKIKTSVLESLRIKADIDELRHVLSNLIDNAIKFSKPGGEVLIEAKRRGEFAEVSVSDTGIGIAKEHLSKVFERFYQADSSSTRRYGGTGLGLAVAKEIVEAHGGRIWAESELDRGTKFTFTIPMSENKI